MNNRLSLHSLLLKITGSNVYYQLPSTTSMKYPAIKYSKNKIQNVHANDSIYYQNISYNIIVISKNVDDPIVDEISKLPKCSFDRQYIQDNLYHNSFNLYY